MQHSGLHSVVEYSKVLFPIYWSESHSHLYLQLCLWLNLTCFAGTGKIVKTKNLDKAMHDLVFKCSRRLYWLKEVATSGAWSCFSTKQSKYESESSEIHTSIRIHFWPIVEKVSLLQKCALVCTGSWMEQFKIVGPLKPPAGAHPLWLEEQISLLSVSTVVWSLSPACTLKLLSEIVWPLIKWWHL